MLARPINFDPIFTRNFFSFEQQKQFSITPISSDFPESPESLKDFFASEAGKAFKEILSTEVDKLIAWADKNGLPSSELNKFKKTYVDYSGSDPQVNSLYFPLYQQGIPALKNINELLKSSDSATFNQTVIKNLIADLAKCAPGAYTIIIDAYLELLGHSNSALMLMSIRRKIAEQLVVELIRPLKVREGLEIHYINGVLNYFSDTLGINTIEDGYIQLCEQRNFDHLSDLFSKQIAKNLNIEEILHQLYSKLALDETIKKLNSSPNSSSIIYEAFEQEINRYGKDEQFYYADTIFLTEDYLTYQKSWKAPYIIFLSLLTRLAHEGILKPDYIIEEIAAPGDLHYSPNYSLRLAYVFLPNADKREQYLPFISYCLDVFAFQDQAKQDELMAFLTSAKLSDAQRLEVIEGIIQYLNSNEFKESDYKDAQLPRLINIIITLDPTLNHWPLILHRLHKDHAQTYFNTIDLQKLLFLIKDENHATTFFPAMAFLPKDKWMTALEHISKLPFTYDELLILAAKQDNVEIVLELLARGASAHKNDKNGDNALTVAVRNGRTDIVKTLLAKGANPNFPDKKGITPILYACNAAQTDIIEALLQGGADPNSANKAYGTSILMWASQQGHEEIVKLILRRNPNVNQTDSKGNSALLEASESGHLIIVDLLLANAAKINAFNDKRMTSIMLAINNGHLDVVKTLIEKGAELNHTNNEGDTALILAVKAGNLEMVEALLRKNANTDSVNKNRDNALMLAVKHGHIDIIKALLQKGAHPDQVGDTGTSILLWACQENRTEVMKILIEAGVDVNRADKKGASILMWTSYYGHREIVEMLLTRNADIQHADENGNTAMMVAISAGHVDIVKMLLAKGANAFDINRAGDTTIMLAARAGSFEMVRLFKELGVEPNHITKNRPTALFWAAQNGNVEIVKFLLAKGANPEIPFKDTLSDLRDFAKNRNVVANAEKVISATLGKKDFFSRMFSSDIPITPMEIAQIMGHDEIVNLIKDVQKNSLHTSRLH